jgi:putative membrane protein
MEHRRTLGVAQKITVNLGRSFVLGAALCVAGSLAMAGTMAKLNDAQIAHIAYTAGKIDVEAATLALKMTHNPAVKAFAEEMERDHASVNKHALVLVETLKMKPEDNDTSKALVVAATQKRQELSKLSGAAFDSAYIQNEVTYHQTVNGALEGTLIPDAQNSELKAFLKTGLKLFKEHQMHAERLVNELPRSLAR